MKQKQRLFIKIILVGNILFILWDIFRHKTYWIGSSVARPLTLWQRICDISHNWWYGMPEEAKVCFIFTMTGILFLVLNIIMED